MIMIFALSFGFNSNPGVLILFESDYVLYLLFVNQEQARYHNKGKAQRNKAL